MYKIIIENHSDVIPDDRVLELVALVVRGGLVSNNGKQYCYLTTFKCQDKEIQISCDMNKKSFKFNVFLVKTLPKMKVNKEKEDE